VKYAFNAVKRRVELLADSDIGYPDFQVLVLGKSRCQARRTYDSNNSTSLRQKMLYQSTTHKSGSASYRK
jgi:hypothetical protein